MLLFAHINLTLPLEDPILKFLLILVIILAAPLLLNKLKIPYLLGLIIAGAVIGPHGLNLVLRDSSIILSGTAGLLYIMFLSGLDMDMSDFRRNSWRSLIFGGYTFCVPLAFGILAGYYILGFPIYSSILLAGLFASQTLIAYPIVSRYGLQQITAKYENSRNQLADTEIRMPFDGYVQKRLFDPSTVVGAGMPVLTVVSAEAPEIEINIPGSEYVRRSEFDGFEAAFDFWPGRRIPLRLRSISPKANANQLYTLRLGVPADLRPLPSPGMNTMVTIVCRPSGAAQVAVPAVALFDDGDRTCVWICREDSTVVSREVRVERLQTGGEAVVGAGLAAGERIVTSGVHRLREGEKVAPLPGVTKTNVGGLL